MVSSFNQVGKFARIKVQYRWKIPGPKKWESPSISKPIFRNFLQGKINSIIQYVKLGKIVNVYLVPSRTSLIKT